MRSDPTRPWYVRVLDSTGEGLRKAFQRFEQTHPLVAGGLLELDDGNMHPHDEDDGAKIPTGGEASLAQEEGAVADCPDPFEGTPLPYLVLRGSTSQGKVHPKKRELRDYLPVTVQAENPKLLGSKVHAAYERYNAATTVNEARALGTSRTMVQYDVGKGSAVVQNLPAVVVLALAATFAPLVEALCAEDGKLGKVGELRLRRVIGYTTADDLSNPSIIKLALDDIRSRSGVHLDGKFPCIPWTAWQRTNLSNAKPETRERILFDRQEFLGYVKTFGRL